MSPPWNRGLSKVDIVTPAKNATVWIEVEDVEASLAVARTAGGAVKQGKQAVPQVGWSAEFTDPNGNPIGIVQFDRGL